MRILDVILTEEKQAIYAIGDSHAVAIGQAGKFIKYAANGRSAFSEENLSAIEEVKPGSIVVLSAGANDRNNQNKGSVIQRIEKLLYTLIEKKKCTVFFVLPAATDAPAFVGEKDMLRKELAKQIPADFPTIKILDLGSLSIKNGDGVHAPMSWYQNAARTVASSAKEVTSTKPVPQSGQPAPADSTAKTDDPLGDFAAQKEKEQAERDKKAAIDQADQVYQGADTKPPASGEAKPESGTTTPKKEFKVPTGNGDDVAKLQLALMVLGYNLGPDKDDGKVGKYTRQAIKDFQKDHNLKETGMFDQGTVDAIANAVNEKIKKGKQPSSPGTNEPRTREPSNKKPGQAPMVPGGTRGTVDPKEVSDYLRSKGMSDNHRAGILANIERESNFDVGNTTGDKGRSWGLFQWQDSGVPRRTNMIKAVPDWKTNWKGQIDYALGEDAGPRYLARKFGTAGEAAAWWSIHWERPKDKQGEAAKRANLAKKYL